MQKFVKSKYTLFLDSARFAKTSCCGVLCILLVMTESKGETVDFVRDVRPIFEQHCYECHGEKEQESGLRLDIKGLALKGGDNHGPDIVPRKVHESPLVKFITTDDENIRMPPGQKLSAGEIATLTAWIAQGADWPDGVDRVQLKDARDHWSFKPIQIASEAHSIDDFIDAKLAERGLQRSPAADPITWLRRITFDLTGLPPTVEEIDAFSESIKIDSTSNFLASYSAVVDRLLASEHYGERWAQHWLDVVRYADTHGFEVNTERPNAWPYRDYVIRAFNNDTPYDQFIKEQICGDAIGEDAATGFLITASVLLPAQTGKDAPSIRLARQDALDEIVNNIGQTFLGLSVGCARCHDHKFDPITAQDYYAMQAFVAGVEYADRELFSPEAEARKKESIPLREEVKSIENQLAQLVPLARPKTKRRSTNAQQNIESFEPIEAKWVRFTILDTNEHPKLGIIEPCIDEFEIYTDEETSRNVGAASEGTRVTASDSRESARHKLEFINDGKYGNSQSWMSGTKGRGSVLFELPRSTRISKIVWSRDRNKELDDRLATAFQLEVGSTFDAMKIVSEVLPLRPTIAADRNNTDRFAPVRTQRLRFTIVETNGHEPCIDEIEVFNSDGKNVALSANGTTVSTSGDTIVAGRHDPDFINDGKYGNENSWLGNQSGSGWVELEFPTEQEIVRVIWSRDRDGKLLDRLPTEYRIEVQLENDWYLVADSTDRRPHINGTGRGSEFILAGLDHDDANLASQLLKQKGILEKRIKELESGQLAFAGKFRQPDEIYVLNRGDPEQPKDKITPQVIHSLGKLSLSEDTPEQDRRRALANWIANPQNPLTARVMANRIWQGHFGTGLVDTPSDFGNSGAKPTHPELLDWLASELIRCGWSLKYLHRVIVLSNTYCQSTQHNPTAANADADVRLLWRFPSRRLEAETIRDSMLAVSGLLNTQMYGRGFNLFSQRGGLSGFTPVETLQPENQRRMIFAHKVRREREAVFGAFDCPDAGQSTSRRRESTTPIQALNLFNSRFTMDVSKAFSDRMQRECGDDIEKQIVRSFVLAYARRPSHDELKELLPIVREQGISVLCRVILNTNEFVTLP